MDVESLFYLNFLSNLSFPLFYFQFNDFLLTTAMSSEASGESDEDPLQSIHINNLPDEILMLIFSSIPKINTSNRSYFGILLLVCKRWKEAIENFHTFGESILFEDQRTLREYQDALKSKRKFRSIFIMIFQNNNFHLNYFKRFFRRQQANLSEAGFQISETKSESVTKFELFTYLMMFKNIQRISIELGGNRVLDEMFLESSILFKNLKFLRIRFYNEKDAKTLQMIDAPNLEHLELYFCSCIEKEWRQSLTFLNRHSAKVKHITFFSENDFEDARNDFVNTHYFNYTKNMLSIKFCRDGKLQMLEFLKSLKNLNEIKYLRINYCDPLIYRYLLHKCMNLEIVDIDHIYIEELTDSIYVPSVKTLVVRDFIANEADISKLHQIFPHTENLRLTETERLTDDLREFIKLLFPKLIDFSFNKKALHFGLPLANGRVYISGTVTLEDDGEWRVSESKIKVVQDDSY